METVGSRIAHLRNGMGLNQTQFAEAISQQLRRMAGDLPAAPVSRGAVANWEASKGIKQSNQIAIAELSGASLDWLLFGRGEPPPVAALEMIGRQFRPLVLPAGLGVDGPRNFAEVIPIYGMAAAALLPTAGASSFGETEAIGHLPMLPGLEGERDVYALIVKEDSMMPMYPPGTPVYISPHRAPHAEDAVVVQELDSNNGGPQTFIKIFERQTPRQLITRQLNPEATITFEKRNGLVVHRVYPLRELVGF
jgi:phage repressor protein C with HTH and peptisase S24 domain